MNNKFVWITVIGLLAWSSVGKAEKQGYQTYSLHIAQNLQRVEDVQLKFDEIMVAEEQSIKNFYQYETAAFSCSNVTEIPQAECEELVNLYHNTGGDNWWTREGWLQTNYPCSWHGITCENGAVIKLYLYKNRLNGTTPNLSALTQLQELSLSNNQLSGTIPNFSKLTQLQYLNLWRNPLSGEIPDFSTLTQLKILRLSWNELSGTIPDFSALTQLEVLDLGKNQLSGTIPDFSALTQLEVLDLGWNKLSGAIPDLSALTQLKELHLWGNQLSGAIPDLSALTQLYRLDLNRNELSGADISNNNLCYNQNFNYGKWTDETAQYPICK